jgi:hypothetical protein
MGEVISLDARRVVHVERMTAPGREEVAVIATGMRYRVICRTLSCTDEEAIELTGRYSYANHPWVLVDEDNCEDIHPDWLAHWGPCPELPGHRWHLLARC